MPKSLKPGTTIIRKDDMLRAQSKAIVARRIMGQSIPTIAAEFNMHHDTVSKRIEWARRHGLIETALDQVLDQLVPEALKTYLLAIQGGDVDASRDVLFGTGVLQKAPKAGQAPMESAEMTIETYRNSRTERVTTSLSSTKAVGSGDPITKHPQGDAAHSTFDIPPSPASVDEDNREDGSPPGGGPVLDVEPEPS